MGPCGRRRSNLGGRVPERFHGFGFALAAVPLLGLVLPPSQAVPIAIGLQFAGGLIDYRSASRECHWPSLKWLMLGAVIGTPVGVWCLSIVSPTAARVLIAVVCSAGTLMLVRGLSFASGAGRGATTAFGLACGLFNGLAAVPGPPAVAYYLASPMGASTRRASLLVFFLVTSVLGSISLWLAGLMTWAVLLPVGLGVPMMFVGGWIGALAFVRADGRGHRSASIAILFGVSAISLARALVDLV